MAWQIIYRSATGNAMATEEAADEAAATARITLFLAGGDFEDVGTTKVNKTLVATIEKLDFTPPPE